MFYRDEKDKLVFKRLDFELMIADMLENTPPKNRSDLDWMVQKMVDGIQLAAWEYWKDEFPDEEEWEDVYYPY